MARSSQTVKTEPAILPNYAAFLADIKARISSARLQAARAVNRELILLYWDIGRQIVEKQSVAGWGDAVVERLAADLRMEFPDVRGFSSRSIWEMKRLYLAYSEPEFLQQAVAELRRKPARPGFLPQAVAEMEGSASQGQTEPTNLSQAVRDLMASVPWGHHRLILDKQSAPAARLYYLRTTAQFGWSRNVLLNQIKAGAYERAVKEKKTHNFPLALPENLAEQADEMLKSRYNLEFLGIHREIKERELEDRLIQHLQAFILELGYGFCFIGRQHRLVLGKKEYFVDLLFYHRFLKSLVAFDLKIGPFEPEHAGKMDFYLNLLNEKERSPGDQPSIGVILCAEKDSLEVEFALKTKANPIGVAEYQLRPRLPSELKGKMPTGKQLTDALRSVLPSSK